MGKKVVVGIIIAISMLSLVMALAVEPGDKPLVTAKNRGDSIGVIYIEGVITGGSGTDGLFASEPGSESIMSQLREAAENDAIKAVIIRINSPGGSAAASQEVGDEVERLRETGKKVVVSMGDVAASGGYWIAAKGDRIVANPATITGSVGVIMQSYNMEELYDKVGLADETIKSGPHKDLGNPGRGMTQEERAILQSMVDDIYGQFVEVVADGRNMKKEDVLKVADGRIYTGRQAKELGLVDDLGNYYDAVRITAELAGIEGEPNIVELGPKDPWARLFGKVKFDLFNSAGYGQLLKAHTLKELDRFLLLRPELINR